jgi:hypothetical protein
MGKAVKTGCSCAAVTHQSRPLRASSNTREKPVDSAISQSHTISEGDGEAGSPTIFLNQKNSLAPHHMRSPNIHPRALTRPARNFCARRIREIFIAKMKRESSALSPIARRGFQNQSSFAQRHLSALATNTRETDP